MQVQRGQHDAQLFWLALLGAVRDAAGTADDAEPPATAPGFNAAAMADRVLAELAAAAGDITLVIDDLHELGSPEAVAQLSRLLANLPPRAHLVLSTRHDLRLRLHQLRLAGELAEIRAAELRFSELETRALLAASGIELSEGSVARLHQRAEGWAAGLRLAVLSLAGHPDPERFVAEFSGSDRAVSEYLIAEMMDRQPTAVQDLLLRTCVLDRVNGELADLLTGRPGSERILLDLEDANAFVVSLDPGRTWFRYHRLLSDFLRLELRRTLPAEVPALAPAGRRVVHRAGPGGRCHPAYPGGRRLAGRGPAARRPLLQHDARRASPDHRGPGAGVPARRGSPRAGLGARHERPRPRAPRRRGCPPGGGRVARRDGAAGSPASAADVDRGRAGVAGQAARSPERRA